MATSFLESIYLEPDGTGLLLYGGGRLYKKVNSGIVTRLASGNTRMQVEDNAGTVLGTYWDSGNLPVTAAHLTGSSANLQTQINAKLSTTGKAADSNLLDGKDSDLYVQGQNGSRTANAYPFGDIAKSGFYDSANATDSPTPNTWAYLIHAAHSSYPAAYAFQIAANFGVGNTEGYFLRMKNTSGTTAWRTIYHSGNLDAVVKNPSAEQKITSYALVVERSAASQAAFAAQIAGDTYGRVALRSDGPVEWGSGAGARDTNLYRAAANLLKTDDVFLAAGGFRSTSYQEGAIGSTGPGIEVHYDSANSRSRVLAYDRTAAARIPLALDGSPINFYANSVLKGSFDAFGNFNLVNLTASRMVSTDASKNLVTLDAAGSRALIGAQSSPIEFSGQAGNYLSWIRIASVTATTDYASYSSCFRASNRRGTFEIFVKFATMGSVAPAPSEEVAVSIGAGNNDVWRVKRIVGTNAVSWEIYYHTREWSEIVNVQQTTVHNSAMTETFPGNYVTTDPGWGSWPSTAYTSSTEHANYGTTFDGTDPFASRGSFTANGGVRTWNGAGPFGSYWYNVVDVRHRNSWKTNDVFGGELAWGMTDYTNRLAFRSRNAAGTPGAWTEVWTKANLPFSYSAPNLTVSANLIGDGISGGISNKSLGSATAKWMQVHAYSVYSDWSYSTSVDAQDINVTNRITCAFVSINDSSTYILPDADPVGAIRIVNGTPALGWNPKVGTSTYVYLTYSLPDGSAYNVQAGIVPVPKRNYMFQKVATDRWCVLGVVS